MDVLRQRHQCVRIEFTRTQEMGTEKVKYQDVQGFLKMSCAECPEHKTTCGLNFGQDSRVYCRRRTHGMPWAQCSGDNFDRTSCVVSTSSVHGRVALSEHGQPILAPLRVRALAIGKEKV